MTGNSSVYLSNKIATVLANQGTFTSPASLWVALLDGSGNEITTTNWSGYTRQQLTPSTVTAVTGTSFNNTNQIQFPTYTGSSITVGGYAVYDASANGNQLYKKTVQSDGTTPISVTVATNQTIQFPAGNFTVGES